jgi:glycosidase
MSNRPWWKDAIGYQVFPRTFYDSNDDGIGDLKGIIAKLDYLKDLGVNLLWICPFFASPHDDSGYDIKDFRQVDPIFGTNGDFIELIKQAHDRKIKVIIDLVLNHTSDEHPWFTKARYNRYSKERNYYIWKDQRIDEYGMIIPPTNWGSFFNESAWAYDEIAKQYYLKIFSNKMPDLNWDNPTLRQQMYEVAKYWLDLGVDGFRLDAIAHLGKDRTFSDSKLPVNNEGYVLDMGKFSSLPHLFDYLNEFKEEVLIRYPRAVTIGEVGGNATPEDALKYSSYRDGSINMVFNFNTCWLNGAFGSENKLDHQIVTDVIELKKEFVKWYDKCANKSWLPIYWLNHDHPRVLSQYGSVRYRKESAKMLISTLLFMYGTPFIYNGDEIGMSNVDYQKITDFKDVSAINYARQASNRLDEEQIIRFLRRTSRINARTPFQWSKDEYAGFSKKRPSVKVNSNYLTVNVENQINDKDSILSFYKKAIKIRKQTDIADAVLEQPFVLIDSQHPDLFIYAHKGNKPIVVISNFRHYEVTYRLNHRIKTVLLHNYPSMAKRGLDLLLRPFESYVIELDPNADI